MDKSGDTEKVKGFINNRNMCFEIWYIQQTYAEY